MVLGVPVECEGVLETWVLLFGAALALGSISEWRTEKNTLEIMEEIEAKASIWQHLRWAIAPPPEGLNVSGKNWRKLKILSSLFLLATIIYSYYYDLHECLPDGLSI